MVDRRLRTAASLPDWRLQELGLDYFRPYNYLTDELLAISTKESDRFYDAGVALKRMMHRAAQFVIDNDLWAEVGIPKNAVEIVQMTWEDARHLHFFSRFDVSGGVDNVPIKLLEYEADVPSMLAETVYYQKEQLKNSRRLRNIGQFNYLYRDLVEQFRRLQMLNPDLEPFLLITTTGHPEDEISADVLADAAEDAGFEVHHEILEKVVFSAVEGIFKKVGEQEYLKFDFWMKLVPWDVMVHDEPELLESLTEIVRKRQAVVINPAYTMLLQSKALLKYVHDLNPGHELLLPASFEVADFERTPHVAKVIFGREGENISIFSANGRVLEQNDGDFGQFPNVYQEYAALAVDSYRDYYQAGLYCVEEPSALSFRRSKSMIVDENAQFLGHLIVKNV